MIYFANLWDIGFADGYTVSTRKNVFGIAQTKTHDLETYNKIVELSKKLPFHYNYEETRISYHNADM